MLDLQNYSSSMQLQKKKNFRGKAIYRREGHEK